MPTSTLYIIEEFLRSPDSQLRRNAITALAAVASPESVSRVVDRVVNDPDESVRARAEQALQDLKPDALGSAVEQLVGALDDPRRRKRAYAVLGRLRAGSPPVPVLWKPLRARLNLARTLAVAGDGMQGLVWRWQVVVRGVLGAFSGLAAAALYLLWAFGAETLKNIGSGLLISLLLAPVLVLVFAWQAQPIALHYFRGAGTVVELGRIVFASIVISVLLGLGIGLLSRGTVLDAASGIGLGALAGATIFTVRAGTIVAYGLSTRRHLNSVAQTGVGTLFGIAMSAASTMTLVRVSGHPEWYGLWVFAIPIIVGVAHAFARIDSIAPSITSLRRRAFAPVAIVPAVIVLFALGWAGFRVPAQGPGRPDLQSSGNLPLKMSLKGLPAHVDFRTSSGAGPIYVRLAGIGYQFFGSTRPLFFTPAGAGTLFVPQLLTVRGEAVEKQSFRSSSGLVDVGNARLSEIPVGPQNDSTIVTLIYEHSRDSLYRFALESREGVTAASILPTLFSALMAGSGNLSQRPLELPAPIDLSISLGKTPESTSEGRDIAERLASPQPLRSYEDSLDEAKRLRMVGQAELYRKGHVTDALLAFSRAQELGGQDVVGAANWNEVCWTGSLQDELMDVRQACDRAVQLDSTNPQFRDSRAVYRARTGDFAGAVKDFRVFVSASTSSGITDEEKRLRRAWLKDLDDANHPKNPFAPEVLQTLRREACQYCRRDSSSPIREDSVVVPQ